MKTLTPPANILFVAGFIFCWMLDAQHLQAATCTWTGGTGNWNNAANWDCGIVPDSDDDVIISGATSIVTLDLATTVKSLTLTASGDLVLNFDLTVSENMSLNHSGCIVNGSGNLTVNGNLTWSRGTIGGSGTFNLSGTLTSSGGSATLDTRSLSLTSGGTWTNNQNFELKNGAVMTIPSEKTLTIDNPNNSQLNGPIGNGGILVNNGTIEKNGAGNLSITHTTLDNNNTFNFNAGGIAFSSGSISTHDDGFVTIGAGLEMNFSGNPGTHAFTSTSITNNGTFKIAQTNTTVTINAGTTLANNISLTGGALILNEAQTFANFSMTAGTVTLNADLTVSNELSMTGSGSKVIDGIGDLTISGNFIWTTGTIKGSGDIIVNGPLNSTLGSSTLETRTMTLNAGGTLTNHSYSLKSNAKFIIPLGQTLNIVNNTSPAKSFTASSGNFGTIENNGTINKSGSVAMEVLHNIVDNNGTMNINVGTWLFSSSSSSTHDNATVSIASGALMEYRGTNHVFTATSINGEGVFKVQSGGNVQINTGCTFSVATEMSSGTLTMNVPATISSLSMYTGTSDLILNENMTVTGDVSMTSSNAEISGPGNLNIDGDLNWDRGTISGAGNLTLNGFFTGNNGQNATLETRDLILNAGANWTNFELDLLQGANLTIPNGQTLTIDLTGTTFGTGGTAGTPGAIINNGTIIKNGTGTYTISNNIFDNNGTLTINAGKLTLGTGSSSTHDGATITIAADAELELGGSSSHTFDNTAISGAGTFSKLSTSTVSLNLGSTITTHVTAWANAGASLIFNIPATIPTLTITSAMVVLNDNLTVTGDAVFNDGNSPVNGISGDGNLTINGNLNWRGGKVSGNGNFTLNGTLTVDNNNVILDTRSLSLTSGGTISASIVFLLSNGATLTVPTDQTLTLHAPSGSVYIRDENLINNGTIEKTGAGTCYLLNSDIENNGTINVNQGTLIFHGTASSAHDGATITIASGSELIFNGANGFGNSTHDFSNTSITGPGIFKVEAYSEVNWNNGTTVSNLPIVLTNGYLDINVNLTINSLTAHAGTDGLLGGTFSTLGVTGNVIWNQSSADIAPDNPAVIIVGGFFDLTNTGNPIFSNATITLNGGSTWTNSSCTMQNNAEFIIPPGQTLTISNTSTKTLTNGTGGGGILTNNGNVVKTGAAIFNINTPYTTASGSITDIQQGTLALNNTFNNLGTVKGIGTINTVGITGTPAYGTFSPGASPGTLTVTGNYTNSILEIEIASASSFDKLVVSGTATLGGTLKVIETTPLSSGTWTILTASSISGTFATLDLPECYNVEIIGGTVVLYKAVTKIWDGSTDDWSNPDRWAPYGVPCPLDDVEIPSGVCNLNIANPEATTMAVFGELSNTVAGPVTITAATTIHPGGTLNLFNPSGTVTFTGTFCNEGSVIGFGEIEDNLAPPCAGTFAPGNSAGTLKVKGTYCNEVAAMEIGETGGTVELDRLEVSQTMETINTLNISQISGTVPAGSYELFKCDGSPNCRSGTFSTITYPAGCAGNCSIEYNPDNARLVLTAPLVYTCTWLGGSGSFNDPANWDCGTVPPAAANIIVNSGTVNFAGNVTVAGITMTGGTLSGTGNLTVTDAFAWSGGIFNLTGSHQIPILNLNNSPALANGTLNLTGVNTWTNANLTISGSAELNVSVGAVLTMTSTVNSSMFSSGGGSFNVFGTLVKDGAATWTFNVPFTLFGLLNILEGIAEFNSNFKYSGTVQGIGTIDLGADVQASGNANFAPGSSPGTLTVQGDYTNFRLNVELLENSGLVTHDLLDVTENATLAGTLAFTHLGGTIPFGSYTILTCGGPGTCLSGNFADIIYPDFCGTQCSVEIDAANDQVNLVYFAPLPVELMRFEGKAAGQSVELTWATASEINFAGYEVQRSANPAAAGWTALGWIVTKGGAGENHYTFSDRSPLQGVNYYRLKMEDVDGTAEFSNMIAIEADSKLDWQVFPNPAGDAVTVLFSEEKTGGLTLFDWSGRQVLALSFKSEKMVKLDLAGLASGVYWLRFSGGGGQRVVKQGG